MKDRVPAVGRKGQKTNNGYCPHYTRDDKDFPCPFYKQQPEIYSLCRRDKKHWAGTVRPLS